MSRCPRPPRPSAPPITASRPEHAEQERRPYAPPKITKKRSVARVTLFSGGGVTAGGLTASG